MMENLTEIHYLSILIIGTGSFIFGILPTIFTFQVTRSRPFFLSLILCLGAGVLLATSLVHMLTEVQIKLKLSAQLYFCAGFLTLYIFDEISHFCVRSKKLEIHSVTTECEGNQNRRSSYGAMHSTVSLAENSNFSEPNHNKNFEIQPSASGRCIEERNETELQQSLLESYSSQTGDSVQDQVVTYSDNRWSSNFIAETGLLIALLIHSVLEGISIGVQTKISQFFRSIDVATGEELAKCLDKTKTGLGLTAQKSYNVLLILGAVMFHKIVLSFCLGLELHHQGLKISHLVIAIFFFSIGSPIGILIGMTATSFEKGFFDVDAQLQAIAAGSLFYVAAFEVLPRERFKWQNKPNQKTAGILQLIFVLLGFTIITIFHFFMDPESGGNKKHASSVPW